MPCMFFCACGYTCGTPKAFDRHIKKFEEEGGHEQVPGPPATPSPCSSKKTSRLSSTFSSMESTGSTSSAGRPPSRNGSLPTVKGATRSDDELMATPMLVRPCSRAGQRRPSPVGFGMEDDLSPLPVRPGSRAGRCGIAPYSRDVEEELTPGPRSRVSTFRQPAMSRAGVNLDGELSRSQSVELARPVKLIPRRLAELRNLPVGEDDLPMSSRAMSRTMPVKNALMPLSLGQVPAGRGPPRMRLIMVRHSQSANRRREAGEAASPDPGLTQLGHRQADALGDKLSDMFRGDIALGEPPSVVCSPMRRCLLTIAPALRRFQLPSGSCTVHGGFYEYGCAGTSFSGTRASRIVNDFPEYTPEGFTNDGHWDYRGDRPKEDQSDCRDRAMRTAEWLLERAFGDVLQLPCNNHRGNCRSDRSKVPTLIFVTHQTFCDAVVQTLLTGTSDGWEYGDVTYRMSNASITELFFFNSSRPALGARNFDNHLWSCS